MKKLKTLEEHNNRISAFYSYVNKPEPNGIACPLCGEELLDSKPHEVLTSLPPQKSTKCSNKACNYTGYRIA